MKKTVSILVILILVVSFAGLTYAASKKKITQVSEPTFSAQRMEVLAREATDILNSRSWSINIVPHNAPRGKGIADVLTFSGNGVISQYLSSKGFAGSKYSLYVQPDNSSVFETVQRDAQDNIAAWRGELRDGNVYGILNLKNSKTGAVERYIFTAQAFAPKVEQKVVVPSTD